VRVRRATAADAQVLGRHRALMFQEMGRLAGSAIEILTLTSAAYFETAIPGGAYAAWVAAPLDQPTLIIAGGGAQRRPLLPRPNDRDPETIVDEEALIVNVYTDPAWRRLGIAALIMQHILDWTRAEGITRVVLHASAAGRPMYERMGFVATNEMRYDEGRVRP
jgi:GNAT superfamily N-acetyltransferase